MAWRTIATGEKNILDIPSYESNMTEGATGLLELNLSSMPAPETILDIEDRLSFIGVTNLKVITENNKISIYFQKGFPWLAAIVAGIIILAILIITWKLFEQIPGLPGLPGLSWIPILGIGGIIAAGFIAVAVIKKK